MSDQVGIWVSKRVCKLPATIAISLGPLWPSEATRLLTIGSDAVPKSFVGATPSQTRSPTHRVSQCDSHWLKFRVFFLILQRRRDGPRYYFKMVTLFPYFLPVEHLMPPLPPCPQMPTKTLLVHQPSLLTRDISEITHHFAYQVFLFQQRSKY